MKRTIPLVILLLSFCAAASAATKTITLTDGSIIKGEVLKLEKGIYTIKTENLGEIPVAEDKVVTITTQAAAVQSTGSTTSSSSSQSSNLKAQTQQVQSQIMGNVQVMEKIGSLLDDPQIKQLIADPSLMRDIMTYDEETIRNNPNVQQLLSNPRIQQLIKEIEQATQTSPQ